MGLEPEESGGCGPSSCPGLLLTHPHLSPRCSPGHADRDTRYGVALSDIYFFPLRRPVSVRGP